MQILSLNGSHKILVLVWIEDTLFKLFVKLIVLR